MRVPAILKSIGSLALMLVIGQSSILAQSPIVKVDMNMSGRTELECNDPNYSPWIPDNATSTSNTFSGVTFKLESTGAGTALRANWYKAGLQAPNYARLGGDCVYVDGGDAGAAIKMTISGLATGTHSLMVYHNAVDGTTTGFAPVDVYVNGSKKISSQKVSQRALAIDDMESSYVTFGATSGQSVVIEYKAVKSTSDGVKNVYINGFELNTPNVKSQATNPYPADGDVHMDGDASTANLTWNAASTAVSHNVYFSTSESEVTNATTSSSCYKGNQTSAKYSVSSLYSMNTYFWRVDEVASNGAVTKGNTWTFRPRLLAFPGAEGYGRYAIGGRGGKVVHVTNLKDDNNPGSLRYAVENEKGPRTIVFDVAGVIVLNSRLVLSDEYVTVAGQTAPGKGICLRTAPFGFTGNNVIARHMRLRLGAGPTYDGMGMTGANHSILDHCSISWTIDESFSSRSGKNITLQKTLISEALNAAGHQNYPAGTEHGYAATISGEIGSFHHNLLAHNYGRNWSLGGGLDGSGYYSGRLSIVNNVVYNWGGRTTDGGAHEVDFIGNYYKPGAGSKIFVALSMDHENNGPGTQKAYFNANKMPGHWDENSQTDGRRETFTKGDYEKYVCFVNSQFSPSYVTTQSADHAYKMVLSDVGATQPQFDDHDIRMINETKNGTYSVTGSVTGKPGFPDKEADAGGYESYPTTSRAANWDSDKDGLPDTWELFLGTNPKSAANDFSDANADEDKDGYTNLEEYLNFLAETHYFVAENGSQTINLSNLFRGFSSSPSYSYSGVTNGTVSISGTTATFTSVNSGFASFNVKVTDASGHSMTKPVGIFVDGSVNAAPTVTLVSPIDKGSSSVGAKVTLTANASDKDGTIAKVVFYATNKATNSMVALSTDTQSPYTFDWTPTEAGTYYLVAKATDNSDVTSNSNILTYTVNSNPENYVYLGTTGDLLYETAGNWDKGTLPTSIDTAIIRTGEAKVNGEIAPTTVRVEANGIFRMIGYYTIPNVVLQGGMIKVYTSSTTYGLNSNVSVEKPSTIMAGSAAASLFVCDLVFSGSSDLTKTSVGVLQLQKSSPNFSGDWFVTDGKLRTRAAHAIGTGNVVISETAFLDLEAVGGLAGCDTLILKSGAVVTVDAAADTVKYLKVNGDVILKGIYTTSNFPEGISGVGTLVILNGDNLTSTLQVTETKDSDALQVIPNPLTKNGYIKYDAEIKYGAKIEGSVQLFIYDESAVAVLKYLAPGKAKGIISFEELGIEKSGVYSAVLYVDGKKTASIKFYY